MNEERKRSLPISIPLMKVSVLTVSLPLHTIFSATLLSVVTTTQPDSLLVSFPLAVLTTLPLPGRHTQPHTVEHSVLQKSRLRMHQDALWYCVDLQDTATLSADGISKLSQIELIPVDYSLELLSEMKFCQSTRNVLDDLNLWKAAHIFSLLRDLNLCLLQKHAFSLAKTTLVKDDTKRLSSLWSQVHRADAVDKAASFISDLTWKLSSVKTVSFNMPILSAL